MPTSRIAGQEPSTLDLDLRRSKRRAFSNTRRFNGMERTSRSWDGVRKDLDLWQEGADCLVHFYAKGSSQRGPSLKVPFTAVKQSKCAYLLNQCLFVRNGQQPSNTSRTSDSGYDSSGSSELESKAYELYVPAPAQLTREQAYTYHVTTRNYFAFLTGQALVGDKLGLALANLWERTCWWQQGQDISSRLLDFCKAQGYLDVTANPQYATAVLNLADRTKQRSLWIHAFAHCVGMHDRLGSNSEFDGLKNTTKALVTRASLEMDLHITRVIRAIGGFLEEEFGAERLGLAKPARDHLDHFRSFLHAYYVDKFGYFPPSDNEPFNKRPWANMYHDFRSLYDYLVDTESDGDMANNCRTLNGGICVLQNVKAFDQRNGYEPLSHPLPLLPKISSGARSTEAQKTLRSFRLGRTDSTSERKLPPRMALAIATNSENREVYANPIVREYERFERQKLEQKVTVAEARKVRWLLIYGVLQMLISITKAPQGVEGADKASYPLCVLTDGCPPWNDDSEPVQTSGQFPDQGGFKIPMPTPEEARIVSIRPDCDAESAQDYFSLGTRDSANATSLKPAPLRITVPLSRTASIRTSVGALQRSVVGSLSRRNSKHIPSQTTAHKSPGHREMLIQSYGYGADAEEDARSEALQKLEGAQPQNAACNTFQDFDFGLNNLMEEPVLEDHQLDVFGLDYFGQVVEPSLHDHQLDNAPVPRFPCLLPQGGPVSSPVEASSPTSATSDSSASNSTRSSCNGPCSTPATTRSSLTYSEPSTGKTCLDSSKGFLSFPKYEQRERASYAQRHLNFGFTHSSTSLKSLNVGCYQPSGIPSEGITPAVSKFALQKLRDGSTDSSHSDASSQYPVESRQADDIEEEEMRGRRRLRALDGFSFNN